MKCEVREQPPRSSRAEAAHRDRLDVVAAPVSHLPDKPEAPERLVGDAACLKLRARAEPASIQWASSTTSSNGSSAAHQAQQIEGGSATPNMSTGCAAPMSNAAASRAA